MVVALLGRPDSGGQTSDENGWVGEWALMRGADDIGLYSRLITIRHKQTVDSVHSSGIDPFSWVEVELARGGPWNIEQSQAIMSPRQVDPSCWHLFTVNIRNPFGDGSLCFPLSWQIKQAAAVWDDSSSSPPFHFRLGWKGHQVEIVRIRVSWPTPPPTIERHYCSWQTSWVSHRLGGPFFTLLLCISIYIVGNLKMFKG